MKALELTRYLEQFEKEHNMRFSDSDRFSLEQYLQCYDFNDETDVYSAVVDVNKVLDNTELSNSLVYYVYYQNALTGFDLENYNTSLSDFSPAVLYNIIEYLVNVIETKSGSKEFSNVVKNVTRILETAPIEYQIFAFTRISKYLEHDATFWSNIFNGDYKWVRKTTQQSLHTLALTAVHQRKLRKQLRRLLMKKHMNL